MYWYGKSTQEAFRLEKTAPIAKGKEKAKKEKEICIFFVSKVEKPHFIRFFFIRMPFATNKRHPRRTFVRLRVTTLRAPFVRSALFSLRPTRLEKTAPIAKGKEKAKKEKAKKEKAKKEKEICTFFVSKLEKTAPIAKDKEKADNGENYGKIQGSDLIL